MEMPTYAKFMKEILTKKIIYISEDTIQLEASCIQIIHTKKLPQKENDIGKDTLHVTVRNVSVKKSLIDLGASISLIPLSVIIKICDLELNKKRMTFQIADKSVKVPLVLPKMS